MKDVMLYLCIFSVAFRKACHRRFDTEYLPGGVLENG